MKRLLAALLMLLTMTACTQQAVLSAPVPQVAEPPTATEPVTEPPTEGPTAPQPSPATALYKADAAYLVALVEETHPCFALNDVSAEYIPAREKLLSECEYAQDQAAFARLCQQYLVTLGDAHTLMYAVYAVKNRLDLTGLVEGDTFYITDTAGNFTGETLAAVNGVPITDLFALVDTHYVAENQAAREYNRRYYSLSEYFLELAGIDILNPICVTKEKDGVQETELIGRTDKPISRGASFVADSKILQDDVFYVDFNKCQQCPQLDDVCAKLEKAVNGDIRKVIVDIRGNGGGTDPACRQLLSAMGMKPPRSGQFIRWSPLTAPIYQITQDYHLPADPSVAVTNPDVTLMILVDQNTFSSANLLATWVQDGKLGTIVGRPYRNNPTAYGATHSFTLPGTGLQGRVSTKRIYRPDETADQETLWPDVQIGLGEDALEVALDLLKNK